MPENRSVDDPQPVEFDAQKANSISMALTSLADNLQRNNHPNAETISEFAERFGRARVEASESDSDTVTLEFPAEGYRMAAAMVRIDGLFRKGDANDAEFDDAIGETIANDRFELSRLLDKAARNAENRD